MDTSDNSIERLFIGSWPVVVSAGKRAKEGDNGGVAAGEMWGAINLAAVVRLGPFVSPRS